MTIDSFLKQVDFKLIFTTIIALALVGYTFFFEPESKTVTKSIEGTLSYLPYVRETGGDFTYKRLVIGLEEYQHEFHVRDCSFQALTQEQIDMLETGKKVILGVKDLNSSPYLVYDIQLGNMKLINVEEANSCYSSSWLKSTVLLLIALILVYFDVKRVLNKGTSSKSE